MRRGRILVDKMWTFLMKRVWIYLLGRLQASCRRVPVEPGFSIDRWQAVWLTDAG